MKEISTILQAEQYIYAFDFFGNLDERKDTLYPLLKTCERLALEHERYPLLCRTRTYLIYLLIEENKLDAAGELAGQNLRTAREMVLEDELLYMIAIIAHLYQLTGNLSASEELIQIALDRAAGMTDDNKICRIYLMIADQYFFTNERRKCLEAFETSIRYALRTGNASLTAICYNNYADKVIHYEQFDGFGEILEAGNRFALESGNKSIISQMNDKFAFYYRQQGDTDKAIDCLVRSVEHHLSTGTISMANEVKLDLALLYLDTRNYAQAFGLLQDLEHVLAASPAQKQLLQLYKLFTRYYEERDDFRNAFEYLRRYNEVNTRIHNEESEEKIKNLQIQYEVKTIQSERDYARNMARIKHDFLSSMSHEIRTPVNNILAVSYLLQQEGLSAKQQDYIARLDRSGRHLLGIINDILDISKIEAGKFHLDTSPFSPEKLFRDIYQQFLANAETKELSLEMVMETELPLACLGDATRIGQVTGNLLSNAIKFTAAGAVRLAVRCASDGSDHVQLTFSVEDTGIGMDAGQLERVFNEYEQAEHHTQARYGGTGLGLSIARKLVALMNGQLEVSSEPGRGSCFTVTLPLETADRNQAETHTPSPVDVRKLTGKLVYIADDLEENRRVIAELLLSLNSGIEIGMAANGSELLERIDERVPDHILLDLDMPVMNGVETAARLRQDPRLQDTCVTACTASLLTLTRSELSEMGFHQLLQKPFTIQQLADIFNHP